MTGVYDWGVCFMHDLYIHTLLVVIVQKLHSMTLRPSQAFVHHLDQRHAAPKHPDTSHLQLFTSTVLAGQYNLFITSSQPAICLFACIKIELARPLHE